MIIAVMILVALAGAAKIIRGGEGRPSLRRTFLGLPLVVIGLSFPFLLEEGCWVPYYKTHVVTRDADAVLTKHGLVTWCPKGCVNVPQEITVRLTVRNNLVYKFEALFTVESPESLVRYLGLDAEDQVASSPDVEVVSSADVETATSRVLKPLLDDYFVMGWSSLTTDEKSFQLEVIQDNLTRIMTFGRWEKCVGGTCRRGVFPIVDMGLAFSGLHGKIVGVATQ